MVARRIVVLDVDGVIVRGRPDDGRPWFAELEADLGLRANALHQAFFEPHWTEIVLGRADLTDRLVPVLARIAPHLTAEQLIAYWFSHDARIDVGLLAEVDALRQRGVPVHLATNQEHRRMQYLMQTLELSRHVDGIHHSATLGLRKPDAAFFDRVAARMRRAPRDLVLVDDMLDNVRGAEAAGWAAVHWTAQKALTELLRPHLNG
jgi:putative hydrolase of the HAD superfamily